MNWTTNRQGAHGATIASAQAMLAAKSNELNERQHSGFLQTRRYSGLLPKIDYSQAIFRFEEFVRNNPFIAHVSLLSHAGALVEQYSRDITIDEDGLEELRFTVHVLRREYPRLGLRRMLLEDETGTVVAIATADGELLIAIADRGTPTGVVVMAVNQLAASLIPETSNR